MAYSKVHAHFEDQLSKLKAVRSLKHKDLLEANILKPKALELGLAYKTSDELISAEMSELYNRMLLLDERKLE